MCDGWSRSVAEVVSGSKILIKFINSPQWRSHKIFTPNICGIELFKLFGDTKDFVKNTQYLEKKSGSSHQQKKFVENLKFFTCFVKIFTVIFYFYHPMIIVGKF